MARVGEREGGEGQSRQRGLGGTNCSVKDKLQWDFPDGPLVKTPGAWVRSLVRELYPACQN